MTMMRWTMLAALLLAGCGGGEEEKQGAGTADRPARAAPAGADADLAYAADPAVPPPAAPEPGIGEGDKAIPAALRGRWALKAADCTASKGADLTVLTIDARTLRFFESAGELARVRERRADRIVADYKFSGEGEEWDGLILLGLADGGKTLVRRDYGEDADPAPLRYTRCAV
jgi:hypothetical protein